MLTKHLKAFDSFWRSISRTEEFIRQYGHYADPDWETRSNHGLASIYELVQPFFAGPHRRMIHNPPGDLNAFSADNYHHALVLVLDPPERWFGNIGLLDTREYHVLKRQVEQEERDLLSNLMVANEVRHDTADLNETELDILEAMSGTPMIWTEIATAAGYAPHTVRRYSTKLQNGGFIQKTKRGFIRLTSASGTVE